MANGSFTTIASATGGDMKTPIRLVAAAIVLTTIPFPIEHANAVDQISSVAIISSVNGEARIAHPIGAQQTDQPKFRGPILYGDHLSTAKDATLGLLVGQNSLLTMRELTDVRVAETVRNQQILDVAKGKVCLAVSKPGEGAAQPMLLRTPTSMITAAIRTLLSIDVEPAPQKSQGQKEEKGMVVLAATRPQLSKETTAPAVETYQVIEGSIDIVSLASSSPPVTLRTGQAMRVTSGVRGQPFTASIVSCRAQDVQIVPVHTNTPAPAQRLMVQQQMQIVGAERVAAMAPVVAAAPSGGTIPGGIYLPFSNDKSLVPTTRTTIQVRLP
jgi:hypothetical protein